MEELKFILESGANLTELLEQGGAWLFAYLFVKMILGFCIAGGLIFALYKIVVYIGNLSQVDKRLIELRHAMGQGHTSWIDKYDYDRMLQWVREKQGDL